MVYWCAGRRLGIGYGLIWQEIWAPEQMGTIVASCMLFDNAFHQTEQEQNHAEHVSVEFRFIRRPSGIGWGVEEDVVNAMPRSDPVPE